jgi:predicted permease
MLARASARQREAAVRLTLGVRRVRLIRQLLTESLLLALLGGALGVWLAYWGAHALMVFVTTVRRDIQLELQPDAHLTVFTAVVIIATGVLFGLLPALRSTRIDLTPALKQGASATPATCARGLGWGGALVIFQVALSILVLIGAGLLARTLINLETLNPGFETRNLLLFSLELPLGAHSDGQVPALYRELQTRFASLPGVTAATFSSDALLSGSYWSQSVSIEGDTGRDEQTQMLAVGPRFFESMRIPLLAGRTFSESDFAPGTSSIVVNQEFVREFLAGRYPLGMHVGGTGSRSVHGVGGEMKKIGREIVGVVADTKYSDVRNDIGPIAYIPISGDSATFELRTSGSPSGLIAAVRQIVNERARDISIHDIRTQSEEIDRRLFNEHLLARLSGGFALLALLLAGVGLYGLLSYEVGRRVREIGIRLALGAERRKLLRMVVGDGLRLSVGGVIAGVAAAAALTRFISSLLYGVGAFDPVTFASVAAVLLIVATAASYIPARRAARVDPMVALRYE